MAKHVSEIPDPKVLKQIVIDYLQGEPLSLINLRLYESIAFQEKSCTAIFKEMELNDKEKAQQDPLIEKILARLDINKSEATNTYPADIIRLFEKSNNVYDLIKNLYHNGYYHLGYLIKQIDKTHPPTDMTSLFLVGAAASAGVGGVFYFKPEYFNAVLKSVTEISVPLAHWTAYSLLTTQNIPLISGAFQGLGLLYDWYYTLTHGTNIPLHEIARLLFKTTSKAFIITANVLSYFTGGLMTTSVTYFFIVGFGIDVLDSLYLLALLYNSRHKLGSEVSQNQWGQQSEHERLINLNNRLIKILSVKLVVAILVIATCLLSTNLTISLICFVFSLFASWARDSIIARINQRADHDLQSKISNIVTDFNLPLPLTLEEKNTKLKCTLLESELATEKHKLAIAESRVSYLEHELERRFTPTTRPTQGAFFKPADEATPSPSPNNNDSCLKFI